MNGHEPRKDVEEVESYDDNDDTYDGDYDDDEFYQQDDDKYDEYDDVPAGHNPNGSKAKKPQSKKVRAQRARCPVVGHIYELLGMPNDELAGHCGIKEVQCYREKLASALLLLTEGGGASSDGLLARGAPPARQFRDEDCPAIATCDFLRSARKYGRVLQSAFLTNGARRGETLAVWIEVRIQDMGDLKYEAYWVWVGVNRPFSLGDCGHPFAHRREKVDPRLSDGEIVAANPVTTAMINVMASPRCSPTYRARLFGAIRALWD
jgi:hypothetical protein